MGCLGTLLFGKLIFWIVFFLCNLMWMGFAVGLSVNYWPSERPDEAATKLTEELKNSYQFTLKEMAKLKAKLAELEVENKGSGMIPTKTYPPVKFLNYKDKKRILVSLWNIVV